jgi:predicted metal-dependent TIM-barrel fold hydrolase
MLVMVHTPHRDKKTGTIRSMEVAVEMGIAPERVVIDHNNEETVEDVLDRGFWAAFTLYPNTKMGNERMVEIARQYGSERIFIDSSADWGVSDPLAVPKTARLMLERGIAAKDVEATCYGNALAAYGQSGQMLEEHWLAPAPSTSARCSRAIPCCVARRRVGAPTESPQGPRRRWRSSRPD